MLFIVVVNDWTCNGFFLMRLLFIPDTEDLRVLYLSFSSKESQMQIHVCCYVSKGLGRGWEQIFLPRHSVCQQVWWQGVSPHGPQRRLQCKYEVEDVPQGYNASSGISATRWECIFKDAYANRILSAGNFPQQCA